VFFFFFPEWQFINKLKSTKINCGEIEK